MRIYSLALDGDAAATSPIATFTASTRVRLKGIQFAVTSIGEADGACVVQVGTHGTYQLPAAYQSQSAPSSILANAVIAHLLTTSGISFPMANFVCPVDLTLEPGQIINVFVGAITGTVNCYGWINLLCD